jgi:hypothetical protein
MPDVTEMTVSQLIEHLHGSVMTEREVTLLGHLVAAIDEIDALTRDVQQLRMDRECGLEA